MPVEIVPPGLAAGCAGPGAGQADEVFQALTIASGPPGARLAIATSSFACTTPRPDDAGHAAVRGIGTRVRLVLLASSGRESSPRRPVKATAGTSGRSPGSAARGSTKSRGPRGSPPPSGPPTSTPTRRRPYERPATKVLRGALSHYEEVVGRPDKMQMPLQVHRRAGDDRPAAEPASRRST
jgi:hypothetical protein